MSKFLSRIDINKEYKILFSLCSLTILQSTISILGYNLPFKSFLGK